LYTRLSVFLSDIGLLWSALQMSSPGSVSQWINLLRAGDPAAAQRLWERYFEKLVELAAHKLNGQPLRAADEEDVALSSFAALCRGLQRGRYPQLRDRTELWRLLVVLTARKVLDLIRHERAQKRTAPHGAGATKIELGLIVGREPTPEFAAQVAEEYERLLDCFPDPALREVAVLKMEGYTNEEIAAKLNCVSRTVERRLRLIRSLWRREITPSDAPLTTGTPGPSQSKMSRSSRHSGRRGP
jgi:DNA-directed RNA polymerase specialized sigma24 family protein